MSINNLFLSENYKTKLKKHFYDKKHLKIKK